MNNLKEDLWKFFTNRLFIMLIVISMSYYLLVLKLFDLQIVNGDEYQRNLKLTTLIDLPISAPRGNIYDKFGRPLAKNESSFSIKLDPSLKIDSKSYNTALYDFIKLLEANDEKYIDTFEISKTEPFVFLFNESKTREQNWKKDMELDKNLTAPQVMAALREKFKIPEELSNIEARKLISIRSSIFLQRFAQYKIITVAVNVKPRTITLLEEENTKYPGIFIDTEPLRKYPQEKYFSHIIGYIAKITREEYEADKEKKYSLFDTVGRTGLEKALEDDLRGVSGNKTVEVDNLRRPVEVIKEEDAVQGNKIFLTMDIDFQKKNYEILKNMLKTILKNKLQGINPKESPITVPKLLAGIVKSNNISVEKLWSSGESSYSHILKTYVLSENPDINIETDEELENCKTIIIEAIEKGRIAPYEILLIMHEQGIITGDEDFVDKLERGRISPLQVILNKIDEDEITPQMAYQDPFSGSIVVVDVNDGSVLSSVTYPSFDTNHLVNNFNNEYWNNLRMDPTSPMYNRPFSEGRAPGSTFKMITAITGLESDTIEPTTTIRDESVFTKAGLPYARCWSKISHSAINVSQAIEVSCNYFFFETVYRLGNSKNGNKLKSIEELNKYMNDFGLNDRTGVEIGELYDTLSIPEGTLRISSPSYKEYKEKISEDTPKSQYDWYDGNTRDTAIGQYMNNYTPASMAKYISTLATRGLRYQLHFLNKIESVKGELVREFKPNLEKTIQLKPETLDAVYKGMLAVTEGGHGTARTVFQDFPIHVAGKTGTAQEILNRNDHSSFGGFAPFEDPQIAVYVSIPFGDTLTTPASAARVAKEVIAQYMGLNDEPERPVSINSLYK